LIDVACGWDSKKWVLWEHKADTGVFLAPDLENCPRAGVARAEKIG